MVLAVIIENCSVSHYIMHVFSLLILTFLLYGCFSDAIIIAVRCSDGIVLGSDGLSVSGSIFTDNRSEKKIYLLNDSTALCCAEGGEQFYHLYNDLRSAVESHDSLCEENERLSLSAIAHMARNLIYKKYPNIHMILAGLNDHSTYNKRLLSQEANEGNKQYSLIEILPKGTKLMNQDKLKRP